MKRSDVRRVDEIAIERFGILGLVLMENAGRGAAESIEAFASIHANHVPRVTVLCGTGNNGGDGYVIARHLDLRGFPVDIVSLVEIEKLSGDARSNAEIAQKSGLSITVAATRQTLEQSIPDDPDAIVVDCLLGTGATGQPRGLYGDAIQIANQRSGTRVAIDLPTGLDCDSGQPSLMTFRADLTITFVDKKDGFSNENAKPFLGRVEVVGIGVPRRLLDEFGVDPQYPR